jgi:hypothetical protein
MSAFFMVADTKGGQGSLSTAKIASAIKVLPNSTDGRHDFATDATSCRHHASRNVPSIALRKALPGQFGSSVFRISP